MFDIFVHMKKKIFFIAALLFTAFGYAQSGNDKIQVIEVATEIFCDHCDQCESCGPNIYNSIKEKRGVRNVDIDSERNRIIVKFNSEKTSAEEIEKSIAMAGYKAN